MNPVSLKQNAYFPAPAYSGEAGESSSDEGILSSAFQPHLPSPSQISAIGSTQSVLKDLEAEEFINPANIAGQGTATQILALKQAVAARNLLQADEASSSRFARHSDDTPGGRSARAPVGQLRLLASALRGAGVARRRFSSVRDGEVSQEKALCVLRGVDGVDARDDRSVWQSGVV
ncbi:hypothetical protein [Mesorhizobium huakuii]|uniref:Uncharacterized protein n=1 Tax=Mesorhizobium huakuii TaxID=28104 RepID=A0A7G6T5X6_9HYPH|nr:hypothetical protein [Mesorhizobium huakuii]QND62158.1 hypothetical protein HB778_39500 [Mesorhizobium huakuii]